MIYQVNSKIDPAILPTPINETEVSLIRVFNEPKLSTLAKMRLILDLAYPDPSLDWAVGSACAVCPPPQARQSFVDNLLRSFFKRYSVTLFLALVGTPLNKIDGEPETVGKTGKRKRSAAGHMWYQVSDMETENAFGFAPIKSGVTGRGIVSIYDTIIYENPYYARTFEITEEHYTQLLKYGKSAIAKMNEDFDLNYHGLKNSCIDFTWKALNSAGLRPEFIGGEADLIRARKLMRTFEGEMRIKANIAHVKSIRPPFPESNLNGEVYHEKPESNLFEDIFIAENATVSDESVF